MAGHNKWSKVKHIKAVVDAKRGRAWSKISKELTIAAKHGGGDVNANPRLRQAVNSAKAANMPNDTIDRAVKKGTGELAGEALEEILYEAYAPGGVAVLIEVVTDNRNRSAQDIRVLLSRNGGSLAESGSVAYQFRRAGEIRVPLDQTDEETLLEAALEAGADDISSDEEDHVVHTPADQLMRVASELKDQRGWEIRSSTPVFIPVTPAPVADPNTARQTIQLLDALDDYEDTQHIHTNFEPAAELDLSVS